MPISHAFVKFRTGLQSVVPLNLILNFSPKCVSDFDKGKKYKVWSNKGGENTLLLNANIVALGCKYTYSLI